MTATVSGDGKSPKGDGVRLRVNVCDALAATKGATKVEHQAALFGVSRSHMFRIRSGDRTASLQLAMRMASDLGTTVEVLFERRIGDGGRSSRRWH